MSSVLQTTGSSQYVEPDAYIDYQLQKTRSGVKTTDMLTATVGSITLLMGYLLAFVILDHWVIPGGFGVGMRVVLLTGVLVACGTWLAIGVVIPYLRRVNSLYAARLIEESNPDLRSTLLTLVDLDEAGRNVSEPVRQTLEKRAAVALSHTDVDLAVDRRMLMRIMYVMLGIVAIGCLYTILTPKKITTSIYRALVPMSEAAVATQTEIIEVKPGDAQVLARSNVEVIVDLRGLAPERVFLLYSTADRKFVDAEVEMRAVEEGSRQFRTLLSGENGRGILQDMSYRIVAGDATSRDFKITVQQPPSARVDAVEYQFPEYMGFPPKNEPGGTIEGWEGTEVTVQATANMPVKSAVILFSDTEDVTQKAEEVRMEVTEGTRLRGKWTLGFRGDANSTYAKFYRIQVKTEKGDVDPQPTLHGITIRPDKKPEVLLLDPTRDLERPANATVPLMISARDDFQLKSVRVKVQKNAQDVPFDGTILDAPQQTFLTQPAFPLKLEALSVKPGDTVTYWVEARDNRSTIRHREGQLANTPVLRIKVIEPVAPQEAKRQFNEDKQRQEEKLEELKQQANEEAGKDQQQDEREQRPQQKGDEVKARQEEKAGEKRRDGNREQGKDDPKEERGERQRGENDNNREQRTEEGDKEGMPQDDQNAGDQKRQGEKQDGQGAGQKSDGKGQEGKGQQKGGSEKGSEAASNTGDGGDPSKPGSQKKTNSDGSDDDRVLQQILDRERQKQKQANEQKKSGEGSDEGSSENTGDRSKSDAAKNDNRQGNDPSDASDPKQDPSKGGDSKSKGKNDKSGQGPKGGDDQSGKDPMEGMSDEKDPKSSKSNDSKSGQGGDAKVGPKSDKSDGKDDAAGSGENKTGKKEEGKTPDNKNPVPGPNSADKPGEKPGDSSKSKTPQDNKSGDGKSPMKTDKSGEGKNDTGDKNSGEGTDPKKTDGNPDKSGKEKNTSSTKSDKGTGDKEKSADSKSNDSKSSDKPDDKPMSGDQDKNDPNGKPDGAGGGEKKPNDPKKPDGKPMAGGGEEGADDKPMPNGKPMGEGKGGEGKGKEDEKSEGKSAEDAKSPEDGKGSNSRKKPEGKPKDGMASDGEETPSDDKNGNATKKKADGSETGKAEAEKDPNADATKAKKPLERRDPNDKGARRPSDETDPEKADRRDDAKSGRKESPRKKNDRNDDQNTKEPQDAAGSKDSDPNGRDPGQRKSPMSSGKESNQNSKEGKEGEEGEGKSDSGKPGDSKSGQSKSGEQPKDGKDGQPSEDGKEGDGKEGDGKSGKPGDSKSGKPGSESKSSDGKEGKEGSESSGKPGEGKSGKSQPGQGKPGEGKPGDDASGKPSGDSGNKPSGASSSGKTGGGGNQNGGSSQDGGSGGEGDSGTTAEEANPEDARKAANLVLRRLEDQIQRGEIDPELLKELGWTQGDMQRFAERLKNQLGDQGDDNSPGAVARRRQFEESLKNLDLRSGAKNRRGSNSEKPDNDAAIGPRKTPVPSEYREAYEAYTRGISKRTTAPAAPKPATK
jgi:hypothetical protein